MNMNDVSVYEGDGSTGGLGGVLGNNKQFIKLPKHYEPSILARDWCNLLFLI